MDFVRQKIGCLCAIASYIVKKLLIWEPIQILDDDGLKETVEWYKKECL